MSRDQIWITDTMSKTGLREIFVAMENLLFRQQMLISLILLVDLP